MLMSRICNARRNSRQQLSVTPGVTTTLQRHDMMSTMTERHLGHHYLRQWRERRGLSLRKLADRMEREPGVPITSHANLNRIERGEQPYNQELLEAAAAALDCTVTDILTRDPFVDDAVAALTRLIEAASKDEQEMALRVIREMLKTGTD